MGWLIAGIVVVVLVVVAVVIASRRRRQATPPAPAPEARPPATPPSAPMTDLESALAKVTDRQGRPIKERLDAEAAHVEPLRDPDDTGPLLRRALDSVAQHDDDEPGAPTAPTGGT